MKTLRFVLLTAVLLMPYASLRAQEADDTQQEMRLNPVIDNQVATEIDYSQYPFLNLNKNIINLNGDDWSGLATKFAGAAAGDSLFSVVYLGDSHIQADFGGAVLRSRLAEAAGSAGRGLIIPFKLAGTNEPNDYSIVINGEYLSSKLMKTPWSTDMPFTGIALQPMSYSCTLHVSAPSPTNRLIFMTQGDRFKVNKVESCGRGLDFEYNADIGELKLGESATEIDITIADAERLVIGGIDLCSDSTGTLVHSVGNNGATFSAYATVPHFGSELSQLSPDLIIIALGTNEAFSRIDTQSLRNNIDILVETIRRHNPESKILLVGPAQCYKKVYRTRGRRRRRTSSMVFNSKTSDVARTIRLYAEEKHIPYYNHYALAGAAERQRACHILSRDGVHYTANGYRLWGNLLADALLKHLMP